MHFQYFSSVSLASLAKINKLPYNAANFRRFLTNSSSNLQNELEQSPVINTLRLNRCVIGFSRREADKLIDSGRIFINGQRARLGDFVRPGDKITLDRKPIDWETYFRHQFTDLAPKTNDKEGINEPLEKGNSSHVYLKLWKEKNVICTTNVNDGMNNLMQTYNFSKHFPKIRLFPVGRLDKETTGLLLITSDPSFQTTLLQQDTSKDKQKKKDDQTHTITEKIYEVTFDREVEGSVLKTWRKGFPLEIPITRDNETKIVTVNTKPCKVTRLRQVESEEKEEREKKQFGRKKGATYEIILKEGKNRQIRRMAENFGYRILSIHRSGFCGVGLSGLPAPGTWKLLLIKRSASYESPS